MHLDLQFRTVAEVCARTTLSVPAVRRLIATQELPSARLGRKVVVLEADLQAFMEARVKRGRATQAQ